MGSSLYFWDIGSDIAVQAPTIIMIIIYSIYDDDDGIPICPPADAPNTIILDVSIPVIIIICDNYNNNNIYIINYLN